VVNRHILNTLNAKDGENLFWLNPEDGEGFDRFVAAVGEGANIPSDDLARSFVHRVPQGFRDSLEDSIAQTDGTGRVAGYSDHVRIVPPSVLVTDSALDFVTDGRILFEIIEQPLSGDELFPLRNDSGASAGITPRVIDDLGEPGTRSNDGFPATR
jgi:hypothetical protein